MLHVKRSAWGRSEMAAGVFTLCQSLETPRWTRLPVDVADDPKKWKTVLNKLSGVIKLANEALLKHPAQQSGRPVLFASLTVL